METFCAQPRIAAMLTAEQAGTWFVADQYGPALCAAHQAWPRRLTGYIAHIVQLGDALLDSHGRLVAATDPPDPASSTPSSNATPTTPPPGNCWRGSTRTPS